VGGVIFGHYGDKIGRKAMLVTTLLIMGIATFLVGCIPGYEAIGALAPIIATALYPTGGTLLISVYIAAVCALSVVCYALAAETYRKDIYEEEPAERRLVAEQQG
jgi:MFS family permease